MEKIKLIWDFRGPASPQTAAHITVFLGITIFVLISN